MKGLTGYAGQVVTLGGEDYRWTGAGWRHVACDGNVGFGDDAITQHVCVGKCRECGEPDPKTTRHDGLAFWVCCGEPVRCPQCRAAHSLRYSDDVGGYCSRCTWQAS